MARCGKTEAHSIYLLGDIFDFWFEYRHAIPKGFIRLQGKLAELRDAGIPIIFFTGNHDMWMFDYFEKELSIPIYRSPRKLLVGEHKLLIGHGDGLGPGDATYKIIKKFLRQQTMSVAVRQTSSELRHWVSQILVAEKQNLQSEKRGEI